MNQHTGIKEIRETGLCNSINHNPPPPLDDYHITFCHLHLSVMIGTVALCLVHWTMEYGLRHGLD